MVRPAKLSSTAGASPAEVSRGCLVADPSAGQKCSVPSGVTGALEQREATERPVTRVNPRRRLDRVSTERAGRPSRAFHGEGNRLRSPRAVDQPREQPPAGLPRGTGDGTTGRPAAEQERPSSAALQWEVRSDK